MKFRRIELLIVRTAQEIKDGEVVIIGQGIPMAAGAYAKKYLAPNCLLLTEAGMVDIDLFQNLDDIGDPGATKGFSYLCDLYDVFTEITYRGFADLCILGAGQIDKYGNVNSTVIGDYNINSRNDWRLPGAGGAPEFSAYAKRIVLTLSGGNLVEKLDYLTSPGWLTGEDAREKAGLPGGPTTVITTFGVFKFDEKTKEMYLAEVFPDTTIELVKEKVPWNLKIADDLIVLEKPSKEDLDFIRWFDPLFGVGTNWGRQRMSSVLPRYFEEQLKNSK